MTDAHDTESHHETYRRTREAFDRMNVDEQASFLVEATASVLARGVEHVGRAVADGLDDLFRGRQPSASHREHGPGPAEPETSQQRRPRGRRSGPTNQ